MLLLLVPAAARAERIRCRFIPPAGAPPGIQYSCNADQITRNFYRRISTCRVTGAGSCLVDIQQFKKVRVWSPDATAEKTFDALPPTLPAQRSVELKTFKRAANVTKGPWILGVTPTTVTLRWETDQTALSQVHIGNQFGAPIQSQWALGPTCQASGATCLHTVTLTGLSAAHNYRYLLGDTAPLVLQPKTLHPTGTVTTAPAGSETWSFAVLGDAQYNASAPWPWREASSDTCAERSNQRDIPGPLLHAGDMVWSSPDDSEWRRFFTQGAQMLANCPFYPVRGNNDDAAGFAKWFLTAAGSATIRAFDYANTHFILLDSNDPTGSAAFLTAELETSAVAAADNLILVVHYGPYGYGGVYPGNGGLQTVIETLLADASHPALFQKLRLVLSGHQHYYERIRKSFTQGLVSRTIRFITVGSAGAELRCPATPGNPAELEASSQENCNLAANGYRFQGLVFRVLGTTIEGRVRDFHYDATGKLIDRPLRDCFAFNAAGVSAPVTCGP